MKKLVVIFFISLFFFSIIPLINSEPLTIPKVNEGYNCIIEKDNIYINNSNVYINAYPHTLSKTGWVEFQINPKKYGGKVDVLFGFTSFNCKPVFAEIFENDKWIDLERDYLTLKREYEGYDNWYILDNVNIPMNHISKLRSYFYAKRGTSGEYLIAIKPSDETFTQSITNNKFHFMHPYWNITYDDIEGHWHLNESSGNIAYDSSPNQYNGTLINMENADWVSGKLNNCLQFDGVNEYVDCGDICNFERDDSFSSECWLKTTSTAMQFLFTKMITSTPRGIIQYMLSGKLQFGLYSSSGNYIQVHTTNTYNNDIFHHVVFTYDGSNSASGMNVYVDNVHESVIVDKDSLTDTILNSEIFRIGARDDGQAWTGFIDEVVIYNKELNQSEVDYRYNSGDGREDIGVPTPPSPTDGFTIYNEYPTNNSYNVDVNLPYTYITILYENVTFNWSIETSHNIGNATGTNDINGTKYCYIDNLEYDTKYTWWVNASNDTYSINNVYYFTTESEITGTYNLQFNESQWVLILTFLIFGFFFYVGYKSEKRSGGLFMLFSGFCLLYLETLLPLSPIFVLPFLSPIAIYIIIIGIMKLLYKENEGDD